MATIGETDDEGMVPRLLRAERPAALGCACPTAKAGGGTKSKRKAEEGNAAHVAAPMPGRLSSLAVEGRGDRQAGPAARRPGSDEDGDHGWRRGKAGTIGEIVLKVGDLVDAKDLIMTIDG